MSNYFTLPELQEIEFKLKILDKIIQEARTNGDERWKNAAAQAEQLNEQRSALIKAEYQKRGEVPPQTTIQAKVGMMGAKTHG